MYIGVDQSYRGCGMAVIDNYGTVITTKQLGQRRATYPAMVEIAAEIAGIVTEIAEIEGEMRVGLEHTGFGYRGSGSYSMQIALTGAIIYALMRQGIDPRIVYPAQWKSKVMGNELRGKKKGTKIQKVDYLETVARVTGNEFDTTDIADAYCIAEYMRITEE